MGRRWDADGAQMGRRWSAIQITTSKHHHEQNIAITCQLRANRANQTKQDMFCCKCTNSWRIHSQQTTQRPRANLEQLPGAPNARNQHKHAHACSHACILTQCANVRRSMCMFVLACTCARAHVHVNCMSGLLWFCAHPPPTDEKNTHACVALRRENPNSVTMTHQTTQTTSTTRHQHAAIKTRQQPHPSSDNHQTCAICTSQPTDENKHRRVRGIEKKRDLFQSQ